MLVHELCLGVGLEKEIEKRSEFRLFQEDENSCFRRREIRKPRRHPGAAAFTRCGDVDDPLVILAECKKRRENLLEKSKKRSGTLKKGRGVNGLIARETEKRELGPQQEAEIERRQKREKERRESNLEEAF